MKIEKTEWKNAGSYGNRTNQIVFDEPKFILIEGANGSGKSYISDIIKFSIYGKLDNRKISSIPNRINKNCWTKTTLVSNQKRVVIESALEPGYLKLFINGKEWDQAGKKNVQNYISNELLDIPYMVFTNTLSLSINDFKSFIKMSPGDKRQIIDKIFSLSVFNEMRQILKVEIKSLTDRKNDLGKKSTHLTNSIKTTVEQIMKLEESLKNKASNQAKELQDQIERLKEIWKLISSDVLNVTQYISSVQQEEKKVKEKYHLVASEIKQLEKQIDLYTQLKCPTCHGDLHDAFHQNLRSSYQDELENHQEEFKKMHNLIRGYEADIKEWNTKLFDLRDKQSRARTKIQGFEESLKKLGNPSTDELQSIQKLNQSFLEERDLIVSQIEEDSQSSQFLDYVDTLLGEDGVKKVIVKQIIPSFNREINKYLAKLGLHYLINFNDELDPIILEFGHEINAETLSTGESKKVDFAVLISVLKMMKTRFSDLNLLFLDEIFSSIDMDSMYQILNILREFQKEMKMTIFVINHSQMPLEFFNEIYHVKKVGGFSQIEIETISTK